MKALLILGLAVLAIAMAGLATPTLAECSGRNVQQLLSDGGLP